jgi:PAS domain S-box-containing protein/diguanylate cyclase (GGDEF)-like protein
LGYFILKQKTEPTLQKTNSTNEKKITINEYNEILDLQNNVLSMVASQENNTQILKQLCFLAEKLLPNSVASIMIVNKSSSLLNILSAPSIPKEGVDALKNIKPGPNNGSCANAIYFNQPQFVMDTFTDPRWRNIRNIATDFNLKACWSVPIRDENNKPIGTFALSSFEHRAPNYFHKKLLETASSIINIVLKNKQNEQRIKLFSSSMQNATEGVVITDSKNKIIEVNDAFKKIYGYSEKEIIGKNPKIFASKRYNKAFYENMWNDLNLKSNWSNEITNRKADGNEITQWLSISALHDEEGSVHNYLAIFTDLTELRQTQKQLKEIAYIDSLTELQNKTQLEIETRNNEVKTIILMNINNFSYINNAYGFNLGDKLLIKTAKMLCKKFGEKHVFRINSDEFALLFDGEINIKEVVNEIDNYFYNEKISLEHISINVSFSYGAAFGKENLLRKSSSSLKQAKKNGKNHLHIFNQYTDEVIQSSRESFVESNNLLYLALNEDKIIPYYQGIRDNTTNKIYKYEVLARIIHNFEVIPPDRFIDAARLAGLLPEITKVIIDKSFKEMASNEHMFSINITEDDLSKKYLLEYLHKKTKEYGIKPKRVILEILEGVSSDGKRNHLRQLSALKRAGFAIAIDDFGSEYSNFERVLDLEIDFLKIDAKYIKDIDINKKSYEVTRAIVFFAQNTGIPCIAEFVHNEYVQEIIEELGIKFSQGYHFSKPQNKPR